MVDEKYREGLDIDGKCQKPNPEIKRSSIFEIRCSLFGVILW
jgi:hypothetical protein